MIPRHLVKVIAGILLLSSLTACSSSDEIGPKTRLGTYSNPQSSLDVILQGKLELDGDRCVILSTDQGSYLALFPDGSVARARGIDVRSHGMIEFGESFDYSGREVTSSSESVQIPEGCIHEKAWMIQLIKD